MPETDILTTRRARAPLTPTSSDASDPPGASNGSGTRPWQGEPSTQLLSALALLIPLAAIACRSHLAARAGFVTLQEMFLGPLLGGGALIFWILFLHLVVCGDELGSLGLRLPRQGVGGPRGIMLGIGPEIGWGVGLAAVMLAFHFAFGATVARLLPPRPPAPQILELLAGVARNPLLLALWLGPVAWIGVALFEELVRVFLLQRLWQVWPGASGRWGVILVVSALIGLGHVYQGWAATLSIGIQSVLLGWVFLSRGRLGALVVGHALYDSVQIALAVPAIRQMAA